MKQSTIMALLTVLIIGIAFFGKYTNSKIHASATTILEDRLKPGPLLSHRFDYYGTYINDALTLSINNIDTLCVHKKQILEAREQTEKEWKAYLATYLVPEEDSVAKLANKQMIKIDEELDAIFKLSETDKIAAQKMLTNSNIMNELSIVKDRINWLTDLQTIVGQKETLKMLDLVKMFDNFMIAAMALAIMLAGSILYSKLKERKDLISQQTKKRTVKKAAVKKKTVKKKK